MGRTWREIGGDGAKWRRRRRRSSAAGAWGSESGDEVVVGETGIDVDEDNNDADDRTMHDHGTDCGRDGYTFALKRRDSVQCASERTKMIKDNYSVEACYQKKSVVISLQEDGLHLSCPAAKSASPSRFTCNFWAGAKTFPTFISFLHLLSVKIVALRDKGDDSHFSHLEQVDDGSNPEFTLLVRAMRPIKGGKSLRLSSFRFQVQDRAKVEAWAAAVMQKTCPSGDKQKPRHFLVLVNPFGGAGKGRKVFEEKCRPIFQAALCTVEVKYTQYRGHAYEMAKAAATNPDMKYTAIVCISGDGLIHEVINGIAANDADDFKQAARQLSSLPVAVIPAGSGNAMSCCLLGPSRGADPYWATLQAIKGKPMTTDLTSITKLNDDDGQGPVASHPKRYLSFLSQAYGLTADCDLGTEHLRWMGDTRFVLGMMTGIFGRRVYGGTLELFIAEKGDDVPWMKEDCRARRAGHIQPPGPDPVNNLARGADQLGDRENGDVSYTKRGQWVTFKGPFSMFYAGLAPYMAKDFFNFPLATANDGLIDITLSMAEGIMDGIKMVTAAVDGSHIDGPIVQYYKVYAYRLRPSVVGVKRRSSNWILRKPKDTHDFLDIDGENVPCEAIQVEAHQGAGRFLSLAQDFVLEHVV